jgi:CHAT domain-containing protein
MIDVCLELGKNNPHFYNRAIEHIDRNKATVLVDLLGNRNLRLDVNIPPNLLEIINNIHQEFIEAHKISFSGKKTEMHYSSYLWRQNAEEFIFEEILPLDPNFSLFKPILTNFNTFQEILDDKTAIIEWYITRTRLCAFIISRNQNHPTVWQYNLQDLQDLGDFMEEFGISYATQLEEDIDISKQWKIQIDSLLTQLSKKLHLDEIVSLIPPSCNQLILIPHWFMHLFPLHALPLADETCLLDRFLEGVRYVPSCQMLQLLEKQNHSDLTNFLAIQNPTGDLLYSDLEVNMIRQLFQPHDQILVQHNATKEAFFQQSLNQIHCLHFSCHGDINVSSVSDIGLRLNDQTLTLADIFDLDLSQCRLVTLSACNSGIIDFEKMTEYLGLSSAFLYAGAASVVSSLWSVNDRSTAFLMIKFYQNLKTIPSVASALNQAQRWLRDATKQDLEEFIQDFHFTIRQDENLDQWLKSLDTTEKPFQSRYHWAAFYAVGN